MKIGPIITVSSPRATRYKAQQTIDARPNFRIEDKYGFLNCGRPIYGLDKNLQESCHLVVKIGLVKLYKIDVHYLSACIAHNHLERALCFVNLYNRDLVGLYFENKFILYDIKHVYCLGAASGD